MYNTAIIIQPAGLGDIFYTLKIGEKLSEVSKNIIWPVIPEFIYLKDRIKTFNIKFVDTWWSEYSKYQNYINITAINSGTTVIVPIHKSNEIYGNTKIMESKYKLVNLDSSDWFNYFNFSRNYKKEKDLKEKLDATGEYVVISDIYASPPNSLQIKVPYDGNKKVIKIGYYDGYNIFDWCGILEGASEIHMIESSWIYILEKLNPVASVYNLYSRNTSKTSPSFLQINHIPKKIKWNYKSW